MLDIESFKRLLLAVCIAVFSQLSATKVCIAAEKAPSPFAHIKLMVKSCTCNECALGLDKSLRRWVGLKPLEIDMEKGEVILVMEKPAPIDLSAIAEAIKKGGHILSAMELEVTGSLIGGPEHRQFRIYPTEQILTFSPMPIRRNLEEYKGKSVRARFVITEGTQDKMREYRLVSILEEDRN